MATPEAALIAALTAEPSVSAIVGARVFIKGGRQGAAYPYVAVQRIGTEGNPHLDGPSELDAASFQIEAWAKTPLEALTLAEAIRTFLEMREREGAGLSFTATFQNQSGPTLDEETRNFGVTQDFNVWHLRS